MTKIKSAFALVAVAAIVLIVSEVDLKAAHVGGLQFNFTVPTGSNLEDMLAGNQGGTNLTLANNVVAGFNTAGHLWSAQFNDPITINVAIDFKSLGSGVLGSTGNSTISSSYSTTRTALIADQISTDDATAVANLQPGSNLDFLTNDTSIGSSPVIRDNDSTTNNNTLKMSRGNAKALGLLGATNAATDGTISFATAFSWDFAQAPSGGEHDFIAVAAHEIGHLMGFVSGVDKVDTVGPPTDLDTSSVFSVLDLYRYSSASLAEDDQPASGAVLDLAYGDTPFFSIDGGTTNLATFSTGKNNGDGRQASHWKDSLGLGLLDPTLGANETGVITALDIQAFDVIGYNLVPEPSALLLAVVSLLAMGTGTGRLRRAR